MILSGDYLFKNGDAFVFGRKSHNATQVEGKFCVVNGAVVLSVEHTKYSINLSSYSTLYCIHML